MKKAICIYLVIGLLLRAIWDYNILPPCLWRSMTGWMCPGCGLTTATVSLMRMDFSGAFQANALVYLLIPLGGYYFYKQRQL